MYGLYYCLRHLVLPRGQYLVIPCQETASLGTTAYNVHVAIQGRTRRAGSKRSISCLCAARYIDHPPRARSNRATRGKYVFDFPSRGSRLWRTPRAVSVHVSIVHVLILLANWLAVAHAWAGTMG